MQLHTLHSTLVRSALAVSFLAPAAVAQIQTSHAWIQGPAGVNFATAHADLDLGTGELAVWADYQGLQGELQRVEAETAAGAPLGQLVLGGVHDGRTHGLFLLDAGEAQDVLTNGIDLAFFTGSSGVAEMEGALRFFTSVTRSFPVGPAQLTAGGGAAGASGTLNVTRFLDGLVSFSCSLPGLGEPITGLELHGPAWFGEDGPLLLDLEPYDQSHLATAFHVIVPAGVLDAAALADIADGFAYVLVRTAGHPSGATRGQTGSGATGDVFCAGASNSTSAVGARLSTAGSPRIADGALQLRTQFVPQGQTLLPLAGLSAGHDFTPFAGGGTLCLAGGPIARLLANVGQGPGIGTLVSTVDPAAIPPNVAVAPGTTVYFQVWYRDTVQGTQTSNFSNAVSVRLR